MKRSFTAIAFAILANAAWAVTPTKLLTVDIGRPEREFILGPISRGATEYVDAALYIRGTAYPTNDLDGYIFYSSSLTSTQGVYIYNDVDATINGHVYFQISATDSLGLSTNASDYPYTNHCQIVLTNSTQKFVWDHGKLILRWDPATAGAGSATLANVTPVSSFLGLSDTPATYLGKAGLTFAVNGTETGIEFTAAGAGDITAVNVTAPVTGGGASGAVTIGVDTNTLATRAWVTANDSDTTYNNGTGIAQSGTTFSLSNDLHNALQDYIASTNLLYADVAANRVTIGTGAVVGGYDPQLHIPMVATQNILIDGRTNQRQIDTGVMRFLHTPAIDNTRAVTYDVDVNSMANTHATVVELTATGLAAGELAIGHDVQGNTADSTGGTIAALEVSKTGTGAASVQAVRTSSGVSPIVQKVGAFAAIETAFDYDGAYSNVTAALNTNATDVTLFAANNDVLYIGMAAKFDAISVVLNTAASGAGIKPTFEYSAGASAWTVFTPLDDTLGFRNDALIWWDTDDLMGWATDTVNAVSSKFWVRITRTQNSLATAPVEDTIQAQTAVVYDWDENANLTVNSVTAKTVAASVGFTGDGSLITALNASELGSGTVPLARLSGVTSNQFDAATRAQLHVAETDPIWSAESNSYVLAAGDTMTGPLFLRGTSYLDVQDGYPVSIGTDGDINMIYNAGPQTFSVAAVTGSTDILIENFNLIDLDGQNGAVVTNATFNPHTTKVPTGFNGVYALTTTGMVNILPDLGGGGGGGTLYSHMYLNQNVNNITSGGGGSKIPLDAIVRNDWNGINTNTFRMYMYALVPHVVSGQVFINDLDSGFAGNVRIHHVTAAGATNVVAYGRSYSAAANAAMTAHATSAIVTPSSTNDYLEMFFIHTDTSNATDVQGPGALAKSLTFISVTRAQ